MKEVTAFGQGGEGDLPGLLREVESWLGSLTGALEEMREVRLEGTDSTGVVRAEVSGVGRLVGLSIDPRGLRDLDHVELAEAVRAAIVAAHLAMGERLTEVTGGLAGPTSGDDPLDSHVRNVLRGD
ncbi:YbaB/EbfC family nucleoid-associated protein [Nonomuraea cavernae]|uniref:YbaB/EbfC family nucleoid-associated protein n=1 Tax=Nonomuraea cavernae TaxID=2045107 RepID=UPI0033D15745